MFCQGKKAHPLYRKERCPKKQMLNPSLPKQIKTLGEDREIANDENEEQALSTRKVNRKLRAD